MSNIKEDRHVEGDWWPEPIPPNVEFGEGFYCETAQIFRKLHAYTVLQFPVYSNLSGYQLFPHWTATAGLRIGPHGKL